MFIFKYWMSSAEFSVLSHFYPVLLRSIHQFVALGIFCSSQKSKFMRTVATYVWKKRYLHMSLCQCFVISIKIKVHKNLDLKILQAYPKQQQKIYWLFHFPLFLNANQWNRRFCEHDRYKPMETVTTTHRQSIPYDEEC